MMATRRRDADLRVVAIRRRAALETEFLSGPMPAGRDLDWAWLAQRTAPASDLRRGGRGENRWIRPPCRCAQRDAVQNGRHHLPYRHSQIGGLGNQLHTA